MTPRWTIGICTWNSVDLLQGTLETIYQLPELETSPQAVEVLVVNNGSTDTTVELLQEFATRPGFRFVLETRLGHTHARNRLVQEAKGDFLLWTDSDVLVPKHWLSAYQSATQDHPSASFWGASIVPVFLGRKPIWLTRNYPLLAGCFAHKELGDTAMALSSKQLPYGANFAVRRDVAQEYLFDAELGRRGSGCVGEDERDFLLRIIQDGHEGWWVPDAAVQHLIPASRMTLDYIAKYFAGQAVVQWKQGDAPNWNRQQFQSAARDHQVWFRMTRWTSPSRVWLEHWIKAAQFRQWAEMAKKVCRT